MQSMNAQPKRQIDLVVCGLGGVGRAVVQQILGELSSAALVVCQH